MTRPLTEALLRALVGEAQAKGDDGPHVARTVLGVAAPPEWPGDPLLDTPAGPARVVPCVSALAAREALTRHAGGEPDETLVLLTDRTEADLGQEVLARLWRRRLLRPSGWEALAHLFRVDGLDPALADHRWLVDLLVEVAPPRGYAPPPGGLLDLTTAWRTLLRHGLRLDTDRPSATDLVRWGQTDAARTVTTGPLAAHSATIAERLAQDAGPAVEVLLGLAAAGRGGDLVPLGLACGVLWPAPVTSDPQLAAAQARFEERTGLGRLDERVASAWAGAAASVFAEAAEVEDGDRLSAWVTAAEHLLAGLDALMFARSSPLLPVAFDQRLADAGRLLVAALGDPVTDRLADLDGAVAAVAGHLRARREPSRVRTLRMALRLARRLADPPPAADDDLARAAATYVADGAWVEAARHALSDGETVEPLASAYGRLAATIDAERLGRDRRFAARLAAWSTLEPTVSRPLLPIERVLDEIVVPVARSTPALLLVLDGLSHPDAIRLLADLASAGWVAHGLAGEPLPLVVAAIPTVTATSRTSLLCGRLADGDQSTERAAFAEHRGLHDAGGPARLFHKRDLGVTQGRVAAAVRDAILDPSERVVGIVVNAVDDHLAKGGQLRMAGGLEGIKPMRPLLDAAMEAGRVVVLTSDHGHVREQGSTVRPAQGAGERWRPADSPPGDAEVEVAGPRVLRGGGRLIAAADQTLRYNATEKHGYHGGATPAEALCPLAVLVPATVALDGWLPLTARPPRWWDPRAVVPEPAQPAPTTAAEAPIVTPDGQVALFGDTGPEPAAAPWVADVLASPVLAEQRRLAGRAALDDRDLAAFLDLLDRAGGVVSASALSAETGLPTARLRTKLEALRRMLNVEGYAVLVLEPDGTARLDRALLAAQFGVTW